MPISMFLTLFTSLCISHRVLRHSWPIIPSLNDLQGESSSSHMASKDAFMELCHDAGKLIPTYTGEDGMGVTMTKQLSIHKGIPSCVHLNCLHLYRLN